jgi:hypothetical protein
MKGFAGLVALGMFGCAGSEPDLAGRLAGCEAELAMKNEKISLLEVVIDRQHELLEGLSRKEKTRGASGVEVPPEAGEQMIRDLRRQLDFALSQLVNLEARSRECIEDQRKEYEVKMDALKERVSRLERQLSEKN